jgi:hypothetical protein
VAVAAPVKVARAEPVAAAALHPRQALLTEFDEERRKFEKVINEAKTVGGSGSATGGGGGELLGISPANRWGQQALSLRRFGADGLERRRQARAREPPGEIRDLAVALPSLCFERLNQPVSFVFNHSTLKVSEVVAIDRRRECPLKGLLHSLDPISECGGIGDRGCDQWGKTGGLEVNPVLLLSVRLLNESPSRGESRGFRATATFAQGQDGWN